MPKYVERRWIPAFAGMTVEKPSDLNVVVSAKAGMTVEKSSDLNVVVSAKFRITVERPPVFCKSWDDNLRAASPNTVIPAQAGIQWR